MINYINRFIQKFKNKILKLVILLLASCILNLVQPYLIGQFIDILNNKKNLKYSIDYAVLLLMIGLTTVVITYISNQFTIRLKTKISFTVNNHLIQHMQKISILKFIKYNPSYLNNRINNDSNTIVSFFLDNFIAIVTEGITISFSIIMLYKTSKIIFCLLVVFIPSYLILFISLRKPIYNRSLNYKENQNRFFNRLNEQFDMIDSIKADASFEHSNKLMRNSFNGLFFSLIKLSRISYIFSSLDDIITIVFQCITFIIAANEIMQGRMTIGQFTIIISYFSILISGIKYYLNFGKSYEEAKASYIRILDLENIPEEANGLLKLKNVDSIVLDDVSFCYQEDKEPLYRSLSCVFTKGKIYTIIGQNGCGKTTLVNIVIGILNENVDGNIYYNNNEKTDVDIYEVRSRLISIMLQNIKYTSDTVYNILELTSEKNLVDYIRKCDLDELYLNTVFDIRNYLFTPANQLSGGEKQKIAFLKALLKGPEVLILDEPTSALDIGSINALKIFLAKYKLNHIIILITHDIRMIEISDETIDLSD